MTEEKDLVQFSIKGQVPVNLEARSGTKKIGCKIIDIQFHHPIQFGEITFSNYYSACISIYVKRQNGQKNVPTSGNQRQSVSEGSENEPFSPSSSHSDESPTAIPSRRDGTPTNGRHPHHKNILIEAADRPWEFSVSKLLMPWPHFELGSQNIFSIQAMESIVDWKDVLQVRMVLHQPSGVWKQFSVDDIKVVRSFPKCPTFRSENSLQKSRLMTLKTNTKKMLISSITVEADAINKQDDLK